MALSKKYLTQRLIKLFVVLFGLLSFGHIALAAPLDFTLPTLDGSQFVRLNETRHPVLINFWGVECPPCVAELPMLEKFSKTHPQWTVLLIATDTLRDVYDFLSRHPIALPILRPGANVTNLMRSFGNRFSALPFSVAINATEQICWRKLGAINKEDLDRLQKDCLSADKK